MNTLIIGSPLGVRAGSAPPYWSTITFDWAAWIMSLSLGIANRCARFAPSTSPRSKSQSSTSHTRVPSRNTNPPSNSFRWRSGSKLSCHARHSGLLRENLRYASRITWEQNLSPSIPRLGATVVNTETRKSRSTSVGMSQPSWVSKGLTVWSLSLRTRIQLTWERSRSGSIARTSFIT